MKKIIVLAAIALFSFTGNAQEVKNENNVKRNIEKEKTIKNKRVKEANYKYKRGANVSKITPEQRNDLRVKQLTLALSLSDKQQKKITELNAKTFNPSSNVYKKRKLTNDELYNLKAERLDKQIAYKREMKKILSKKQFEKWENLNKNRMAQNNRMIHKKFVQNPKKIEKK